MRHTWRLLLSRNYPRSSLRSAGFSSSHHVRFQVISSPLSKLPSQSSFHTLSSQTTYFGRCVSFINSRNLVAYSYSTEPLVEPEKDQDQCSLVSDIFAKFSEADLINKELESNNVVITHEIVLKVLKSLGSSPDAARRFFNWVLERDSERLSSKAYNLMLGSLGANGKMEEFWDLVETMKKKGYGVSGGTRDRVVKKLEEEGLQQDLEKLKGVFASGSVDKSVEKTGLIMSRIVKNKVWGDEVESQIKDLGAVFTSELVKIVLENLAMEPLKALIFFRWVDESGQYKHDETTYNAMARILGREDCIERFQKVLDEMKSNNYELELETYNKVVERFIKRKMIKEAVDLYEFSMTGTDKPSVHCCTLLLKKIVASKELDMDLFSRVVKLFVGNDNVLTDSTLDALLKSLTSVGRIGECNRLLKEMKESGFVPSGKLQSKIVSGLVDAGKDDEVSEFKDNLEESGGNLDYKAWTSLIQRHCAYGNVEKALEHFHEMVDKGGASNTGYIFDCLINAHCSNKRAVDASKLLDRFSNQLKPWQSTYKQVIDKLLARGEFKHALPLLDSMKGHGYPPLKDPFIKYVSKRGTSDNAVDFMRAMTRKRFPSTSVVLELFEAFFKAGRHSEAQDFLAKCPRFIRNHPDVLNLFHRMHGGKDADAPAALAV